MDRVADTVTGPNEKGDGDMNLFDLSGRITLVTGGIGLAIA